MIRASGRAKALAASTNTPIHIMKDGKIVEEGATDAIFNNPTADYTKTLIQSAFTADVAA